MMGLYGRKLGMTHVFNELGTRVPVTVLMASPSTVVDSRTSEKNGYPALRLGWEKADPGKVNKAREGVFGKAGVDAHYKLYEVSPDIAKESKAGDELTVAVFAKCSKVSVTGVSKGHGFSGTIKRYGFKRGPSAHGSKNVREPGSSGASTYPARVFPGKKLPGQYGNKNTTVHNLRVEKVDEEKNLIYVRGAVPGPKNGIVLVRID